MVSKLILSQQRKWYCWRWREEKEISEGYINGSIVWYKRGMEVCPAAGEEALCPDLSTFNKQLEENRVGREKATYKYIAIKELDLLSLKKGAWMDIISWYEKHLYRKIIRSSISGA